MISAVLSALISFIIGMPACRGENLLVIDHNVLRAGVYALGQLTVSTY